MKTLEEKLNDVILSYVVDFRHFILDDAVGYLDQGYHPEEARRAIEPDVERILADVKETARYIGGLGGELILATLDYLTVKKVSSRLVAAVVKREA